MVSKMGVIKKVPSEVKQLKRVIMTSRERRCHVRNVPDARESEVLSLFATIIDKYKVIMQDDVPHIFEAVFQCTLEMITKNFEDYPEHRLKFFSLLRAIATFCFRALIQLSSEQLKLVMDSVIWAFRHTERNIAETGLNLLLAMLKNFQKSDFCNQFYRTYFMQIEQEIFAVLTDTFHKPGFKLHVLVLQHLFSLVESDSLTEPLWDTVTVPHPYPSNADFVREYTIKLLSSSFPNMTPSEVAPRNTVGDVPLEWCKDEKHIGYDITGKKITKREKQDKLDSALDETLGDSNPHYCKIVREQMAVREAASKAM